MRVSGRWIAGGLVVFTAIFAGGLWYAQNHAFYNETEASEVVIAGRAYPVTEWQGIDAATSPLKLRACFRLDAVPEAPVSEAPVPLVAPSWFDCFDAEAIAGALARGEAVAYVAAVEEHDGADRIVARFPDGRAVMWRQLNGKYAE